MMVFRPLPLSGLLAALAASAFALASCHGANDGYTPSGAVLQSVEAKRPLQLSGARLSEANAPPATQCKFNTLPGTYVFTYATGNVRNGTFTPAPGAGTTVWERYHAESTGMPTPQPTPTPKHPPYYFYLGTYTDKHNGVVDTIACASFLTTQDGSPLPNTNGKYNAEDVNSPTFSHMVKITRILGVGTVTSMKISGLSATGGKGTYVLSDGSTGVIKFTQRISLP